MYYLVWKRWSAVIIKGLTVCIDSLAECFSVVAVYISSVKWSIIAALILLIVFSSTSYLLVSVIVCRQQIADELRRVLSQLKEEARTLSDFDLLFSWRWIRKIKDFGRCARISCRFRNLSSWNLRFWLRYVLRSGVCSSRASSFIVILILLYVSWWSYILFHESISRIGLWRFWITCLIFIRFDHIQCWWDFCTWDSHCCVWPIKNNIVLACSSVRLGCLDLATIFSIAAGRIPVQLQFDSFGLAWIAHWWFILIFGRLQCQILQRRIYLVSRCVVPLWLVWTHIADRLLLDWFLKNL